MENDELNKKLSDVLSKHQAKIDSIKNFEIHFDELVKRIEQVVHSINPLLEEKTGGGLRIYSHNPVDLSTGFHNNYIMVKYLPDVKNDIYNLNSSKFTDYIEYRGNPSKGMVVIKYFTNIINTSSKNELKYSKEFKARINELNEDSLTELIIEFIDEIFS